MHVRAGDRCTAAVLSRLGGRYDREMGNLGWYQTMTAVTKALGGPGKALAVVGTGIALAGYGVFRGVEAGGKQIYRLAVKNRSAPSSTEGQIFTVIEDGEAGGGLTLHPGDEVHILECDGDAILIEVLGDAHNPYFVSGALLASISDFHAADSAESA